MNRLTKSKPLTEYEAMNLSLTDLYMRLKAYEDTGLEPEQCAKYAQAEKEGRLTNDETPIKCTGLNCPMQAGKIHPETCKAADTCEWATKPLTNADRIRAMTDEEMAEWLCAVATEFNVAITPKEWLDWLKQEVSDDHRID